MPPPQPNTRSGGSHTSPSPSGSICPQLRGRWEELAAGEGVSPSWGCEAPQPPVGGGSYEGREGSRTERVEKVSQACPPPQPNKNPSAEAQVLENFLYQQLMCPQLVPFGARCPLHHPRAPHSGTCTGPEAKESVCQEGKRQNKTKQNSGRRRLEEGAGDMADSGVPLGWGWPGSGARAQGTQG